MEDSKQKSAVGIIDVVGAVVVYAPQTRPVSQIGSQMKAPCTDCDQWRPTAFRGDKSLTSDLSTGSTDTHDAAESYINYQNRKNKAEVPAMFGVHTTQSQRSSLQLLYHPHLSVVAALEELHYY